MARPFKLPDLGEGIHEGEVIAVLVSEGDQVTEGQPILEVETDKASVQIPCPFSGVVQEINVRPNDVVRVGTVMMTFGEKDALSVEPPAVPIAAPVTNGHTHEGQVAFEGDRAIRPEEPVPASPATRRLAREMGVDLHMIPGSGPAGLVTAADVRAFAVRAESPNGVGTSAGTARDVPAEASTPFGEQASSSEQSAAGGIAVPPLPDFGKWGPVERTPLRSVRRSTAHHMALSWSQIPHVNHQDVADITLLEEYRRKHVAQIEAMGGKLTMTVFVMKAAVVALKAYPRFNSSLDTATQEIILKRYHHLGIAADSERGLVVPVIKDVDRKSIVELAVELKGMAERAREGQTALEEMQGGTFTITNIGALGGTGFAPIINYPQVAILGMGRARLRPVVLGDLESYEIVPRLMLPLVLAFDHRVLDGADAARFLGMIKESLEDPDQLWLKI